MLTESRWRICCVLLLVAGGLSAAEYKSGIIWPEPPVVDPGGPDTPPSDAIVLFDGSSLDAWKGAEGWKIEEGVALPVKGGISTKQAFGDIQLHLEWATPAEIKGHGQGRGNSGVYLMGQYEVQILDSHNNPTYFDGQAGSLYKQWPPLVNASRPPGEWQTYDILFTAPRFDEQGTLLRPAYATVLHNGVVVQNHAELQGGTSWESPPRYKKHAAAAPIQLQYHGNPVRFRNIWVRELVDPAPEIPLVLGKSN